MSVFDKLLEVGSLVQERYQEHFTLDEDAPEVDAEASEPEAGEEAASAPAPDDAPRVTDVAAAYAILELKAGAPLVEVRAAYDALAQRYHPQLGEGEEGQATGLVMLALLDALELLELELVQP